MKNSIIPIQRIYQCDLEKDFTKVADLRVLLAEQLHYDFVDIQPVISGQGLNYRLLTKQVVLFLSIRKIPGYPNKTALEKCYLLLKENNLPYRRLLYEESSSQLFPYGFLIHEWINATHLPSDNLNWVSNIALCLKQIHKISCFSFGMINQTLCYPSLKKYYDNLDCIIAGSFGQAMEPIMPKELETLGIVACGFMDHIFEAITNIGQKVHTIFPAVLIHGDPLLSNLLQTNKNQFLLIDWDEAKMGCWVWDLARLLYYHEPKPAILDLFIEHYCPEDEKRDDILNVIRLETIKQLIRQFYILGMQHQEIDALRPLSKQIENKINTIILDEGSILGCTP
jgi:thiamine kinase-like enzyme